VIHVFPPGDTLEQLSSPSQSGSGGAPDPPLKFQPEQLAPPPLALAN